MMQRGLWAQARRPTEAEQPLLRSDRSDGRSDRRSDYRNRARSRRGPLVVDAQY